MEIGPFTERLVDILGGVFGGILSILLLLALLIIGMVIAMLISYVPAIILISLAILVGFLFNTDAAIGLVVVWVIGLALRIGEW
ncbi:hypothetical protein [Natrialba hulunbeirensis]|uniref:hypothetical protein n=1 Tax=Natrialba hulunbeirensis TaxID=123783 RepID=UPI00126827CA|nr:hypothetical protein [Natrialba hulunbeirensis]